MASLVKITASKFHVKAKAKAGMKMAIGAVENAPHEIWEQLNLSTTAEQLMAAWGWPVLGDNKADSPITGITYSHTGNFRHVGNSTLFAAIAKYVDSGSYIRLSVDGSDNMYNWTFEDGVLYNHDIPERKYEPVTDPFRLAARFRW